MKPHIHLMLQTRKEREFERTSDPWKRSRLVGERISEMMGKTRRQYKSY